MCPLRTYCRVQWNWILIKSQAGFRNSNLSEDPQPITSCSERGLHLWSSCSSQPRLSLLQTLFSLCPSSDAQLVTAIACARELKGQVFRKVGDSAGLDCFSKKAKDRRLVVPHLTSFPVFSFSISFYFTLTLLLSYITSRSRTHVNSTCTCR